VLCSFAAAGLITVLLENELQLQHSLPLSPPSLNGATRMCFLPGMEEGMEIASKRQLNCLAQLRPPSPAPLILLPDMFSEDCWREMGSLATVSWED